MIRTVRAALAAAASIALSVAAAAPVAAADLPLVFDASPRIWGLDLGVGYTGRKLLEGRQTTLWAWAGGGWEKMPFYRQGDSTLVAEYLDLASGAVVDLPVAIDAATDPFFQRAEAKWQLGIEQGLVAAPEEELPDLLVAFLYYRGRYDAHLDQGVLLSGTDLAALPDRDGIFQNSVLAGLAWQGVTKDAHTVRSGFAAEASLEWGPSSFIATGGTEDFLRLNATARGFLPIWDAAPEGDRNLFSVYAGDFVSVDWVTGESVPLNVRQSFGGRSPRTGLGGAVRGVDSGSLDANFKAVNNLEVRVLGPAIVLPNIVPGLVAYVDAGLFGTVGEPFAADWGFVASSGAGVFVDVFGFAQLTAYLHYRLVGENANGSALTPFAIDFTLKF